MNVLNVNSLTKSYRRNRAIHNLSLQVDKGQVYGLLGPNGSGKTTTLGIILGILSATSGSYSWFEGVSPDQARRKIGALLEKPNFYPWLSARQNLKIVAAIKNTDTRLIDGVLTNVNLSHAANQKFEHFSLGMKQRLAIASCLLGDPEVLVLDEPTNGVDAEGIAEIRSLILQLREQGKTIILASHMLDEVEKVCSHVGIIHHGAVAESGDINQVIGAGETIELRCNDNLKAQQFLQDRNEIKGLKVEKDMIHLSVANDFDTAQFNKLLVENQIYPSHLTKRSQSLEKHFLELLEKSRAK